MTIVLSPDDNLSSFFIFASMYIKSFIVSDVDEVLSFIGEDLPPA
jgi:hypothetical protein